MKFNPFEYLRDIRSMDDSMERESTKGAYDSDRKPFSKLEEERVDPLFDCANLVFHHYVHILTHVAIVHKCVLFCTTLDCHIVIGTSL